MALQSIHKSLLLVSIEALQQLQVLNCRFRRVVSSEPWNYIKSQKEMTKAANTSLFLRRHGKVVLEDEGFQSINDSHHKTSLDSWRRHYLTGAVIIFPPCLPPAT